jgi:hypothetical protein
MSEVKFAVVSQAKNIRQYESIEEQLTIFGDNVSYSTASSVP